MAFVEGMTPQQIRKELSFAVKTQLENLRDQLVIEERKKAEQAREEASEFAAIAVTAAQIFFGPDLPEELR